ncbi:MAG: hypothetical protein ACFFC6_10290 [Promethearchaeota archaeon]
MTKRSYPSIKNFKLHDYHKICFIRLAFLTSITFLVLSNIYPLNSNFSNNIFQKPTISLLWNNTKPNEASQESDDPLFALQPFQHPRIMFIISSSGPDPILDEPFYNFMKGSLDFNVTYQYDNNSYTTENYDAIVISGSINDTNVQELATVSIPILTMAAETYNEFNLGKRTSTPFLNDSFFIINVNHYITQGLPNNNDLIVYNQDGEITYIGGYDELSPSSEIISLAKPDDRPKFRWDRSLVALDKGKIGYNETLAPAAERRVFWGANQGLYLNMIGWDLWQSAVKWILYDDICGDATITVAVKDLDNRNVHNARVTLISAYNDSQFFSQNTTMEGLTTFTNIPFCCYNITVEFEDSINDSLSLLKIVSKCTYHSTAEFDFNVRVDEYIDNESPIISNVGFFLSNRTFHAEVIDASTLTIVNLSLRISNASFTRNKNYTMVTTNGIRYYNDTALHGLETHLSGMDVSYKVIAVDIADNQDESIEYFYSFPGGIASTVSTVKSTSTIASSIFPPNTLNDITKLFPYMLFSTVFLIFLIVPVRKKYQGRRRKKMEHKKAIIQRFSDILNIRAVICRNAHGLAFYSENFLTMAHDLDLAAGLTSAITNLVTELSQRELKSGQFDLLERENFGILSHHGEYSTISVVSEEKLSEYTKERIIELHAAIEEELSQQELEDYNIREPSSKSQTLVYDHLLLGLLRQLHFDYKLFKARKEQFKESEIRLVNLLQQMPSLVDGQIIFYVSTFISNLSLYGIPTYDIYLFLEKCYQLKVISPLSDEQIRFLNLFYKEPLSDPQT